MNKITTVKAIYPAKKKDGSMVSGVSPKGKPWQLYNVVDKDDMRFGGFEIPTDIKEGTEVFIDYEVEKNGNFTNNKIKKIAAIQKTVNIETGEESGTNSHEGPTDANFAQLEARVAVLEGIVLKKEMEADETIKAEDLPF